MHPVIRFFIRITIILAIILFAIQPFNWFCQISQSCKPFFFSYYIPKQKGDIAIDVIFEVMNYNEALHFYNEKSNLTTFTNSKNIITYHAKNTSEKPISFRPKLIIEPEYAEKYLIRYQCLCMQELKLKKGETANLKMEFEIDKKIENDENFKKQNEKKITIRYKI
jgi:cytochrome c oxidase assembly protein Cox11